MSPVRWWRKVGLNLAKGPHAHVLEVGLAQARLAQHLAERRLFESVKRISVPQALVALPSDLNVLEQVTHIICRQPLAMSAAFGLARRRLEEVCERRKREGSAVERSGDGLQINEGTAPVAGRNLPLALSSRVPPLRGMRELDQRGASIEVADLDSRPPPELRQLKRESASHRFAAS